ncbi:uncharacterized protein [Battus philenor]|uniref:uncharacterized protein isoform X2 n=1 Tax=Battus philenor TaxID=42288 RepID=UPI0035D0D486
MTIIVVSGLPPRWDMKLTVRKLARTVKGQFKALTIKCTKKSRDCYIRLSEMLNPQSVVSKINNATFGQFKLHAYIPDVIPYLPPTIKPRLIPFKLRRALHIANESTLGEVLYSAHSEILEEMQIKYVKLFDLSKNGDHVLLTKISEILLDRLRNIMKSNVHDSSFKLTSTYRKTHPHSGDFQLIESTLNELEDIEGKPRTQLDKNELMSFETQHHLVHNVSYSKALEITNEYIKRIKARLMEYAESLKTESQSESKPVDAPESEAKLVEDPDSEQAAAVRVRGEMMKILPYLPIIVPQVVKNNFAPKKVLYYKIRLYGEPYMPSKEAIKPFLKKHHACKIYRSDRMYNLLCCTVRISALNAFLQADGTEVAGTKMVIRLADAQLYKVPESMKQEMLVGLSQKEDTERTDADANMDGVE